MSTGVPLLTVDGVAVKLSTLDNCQIKVEEGGLRLSLEGYTGEVFFSTAQTESGSKRKASFHIGAECTTPSRTEDPSTFPTVKKHATSVNKTSTAQPSSHSKDAEEEVSIEIEDPPAAHQALANAGGVVVLGDQDTGEGVFFFLGGKDAVKGGYVKVSCSGYDPTKKRPEDLVAGRKGGSGCMALPDSDSGLTFFEFTLREDMMVAVSGYVLRNGSRDLGNFLKHWVMEILVDGKWVVVSEEDGDMLDGCKQAAESFNVDVSHRHDFTRRVRIRMLGNPDADLHKLWLASVELFGTLRLVE